MYVDYNLTRRSEVPMSIRRRKGKEKPQRATCDVIIKIPIHTHRKLALLHTKFVTNTSTLLSAEHKENLNKTISKIKSSKLTCETKQSNL